MRKAIPCVCALLAIALGFASPAAAASAGKETLCLPAPGAGQLLAVVAIGPPHAIKGLGAGGLPDDAVLGFGTAKERTGRHRQAASFAVGGSAELSTRNCVPVYLDGRPSRVFVFTLACKTTVVNKSVRLPSYGGAGKLPTVAQKALQKATKVITDDWLNAGCPND